MVYEAGKIDATMLFATMPCLTSGKERSNKIEKESQFQFCFLSLPEKSIDFRVFNSMLVFLKDCVKERNDVG